jgi:hypothetical protein
MAFHIRVGQRRIRILTPPCVSPPTAPSGLNATATSSTEIDLSWTENSSNVTSFVVQRSPDGSTGWTQVGSTAATTTTYANTGLAASTTYYYRVLASGPGGTSSPSNVASATTQASTSVTTYTLSGPSTGVVSSPSGAFTVTLGSGSLSGSVTITPSDGGAGGSFSPASVSLSGAVRTATFTYTPIAAGTVTIATTNNGGLTDPAGISYTVTAGASYTVTSAASSGPPNAINFLTITPLAPITGTITATPSGCGLIGPYPCTWSNSKAAQTININPPQAGTATLTFSNNCGLTDCSPVTYAVGSLSPSSLNMNANGPTWGLVGVPSGIFGVSLGIGTGTLPSPVTVTPNDGGRGGTFTPSSFTLDNNARGAVFTYTAATAGAITISLANNGSLTNPAGWTYTANALSVVDVNSSWLGANAGADGSYSLTSSNTKYVLQTNVTTPAEAFKINAGGIVLDLNGYTITYDNGTAVTNITNGGFEQGNFTGWNVTGAPAAAVVPQVEMWGSYMCQLLNYTTTQVMLSSTFTVPTAGIEYLASLTCGGSGHVILDVLDGGSNVIATGNIDASHGAGLPVHFTPTTTAPFTLRITCTVLGSSSTVDLDYVQVQHGALPGGDGTYGAYGVGCYQKTGCMITSSQTGGQIVQGQRGSWKGYPIWGSAAHALTVSNLTLSAWGTDTGGIYMPYPLGLSVVNNTINLNVNQIMNRMALTAAITANSNQNPLYISGNQISGNIQSGIVTNGGGNPLNAVNIVKNNTDTHASVWTDGYCFELYGGGYAFEVGNNTFTPTYGRGILIDLSGGASCYNNYIHDNTITVQELGDLEFGRNGLEVAGIRMRSYGNSLIKNNYFYHNTVTANVGGTNSVWAAVALRLNHQNAAGYMDNCNNVFDSNHFKAIITAADATLAQQAAWAVDLAWVAPNVYPQFVNNTFESDDTSVNLGSDDGSFPNTVTFINSTFAKSSGGITTIKGIDYAFDGARGYVASCGSYLGGAIANIRFISPQYSGGASQAMALYGTGAKDIFWGWRLSVSVVDTSNNPVPGATVTITDNQGTQQFAGTTDASGNCSQIPLNTTEYTVPPGGGGYPNANHPLVTDRSTMSISVVAGTKSGAGHLTLTSDQSTTITVS